MTGSRQSDRPAARVAALPGVQWLGPPTDVLGNDDAALPPLLWLGHNREATMRMEDVTCFSGSDQLPAEGDASHEPREAEWYEIFFVSNGPRAGQLTVMAWCEQCFHQRQRDLDADLDRFGDYDEAEFVRRPPASEPQAE